MDVHIDELRSGRSWKGEGCLPRLLLMTFVLRLWHLGGLTDCSALGKLPMLAVFLPCGANASPLGGDL